MHKQTSENWPLTSVSSLSLYLCGRQSKVVVLFADGAVFEVTCKMHQFLGIDRRNVLNDTSV